MPLTDQVLVNSYTGNGVTTSFAYGFKIWANTDLKVTVDGATKVLTTDYTVSGVGADGGGNVTFVTAPASLAVVTISSEVAYNRATDYQDNGDLAAATLDNDLDKNTRLIQQIRRDVKRAIKLPIEEADDKAISTVPASRANKVMAFDAAGAPAARSIADLSSVVTAVDASLTLAGSTLSVTNPVLRAVAAGTVDAITATVSPAPAALVNNLTVLIEATGANAATAPTLNLNSLGVKTIVKGSNTALQPGDIAGADYKMHLVFDASLDKWVLLNPYVNRAAIQSGSLAYIADTGAADAYVATLVPAPTANPEGMEVAVKITNANLTATPTLNVNGIGAGTIVRENSAALVASDLPAGHIAVFRRKGSAWLLLNPCTVAQTALPDGSVVQVVNYQTGAFATGSTAIPLDDTIPQNTEGNEYMTLAITPKATTNKLIIEAYGLFYGGGNRNITMALFQDSTADALAAVLDEVDPTSAAITNTGISLRHFMTAGTISATTFKIRAGNSSALAINFNGNTARLYGGVAASSITITEVKA